MKPGVRKTFASYNTLSATASLLLAESGMRPHRNIPTWRSSYSHPKARIICPAKSRRLRYTSFMRSYHSFGALNASTAAYCIGLNCPESILLFTFSTHCTKRAFEANIAIRHPGMLCALLMEFSSMQTSFAPGTLRMLSGWSFRMKLYGLSLQTTMPCFRPKATKRSYSSLLAFAPVGILG